MNPVTQTDERITRCLLFHFSALVISDGDNAKGEQEHETEHEKRKRAVRYLTIIVQSNL